jgi:hypothetical protein
MKENNGAWHVLIGSQKYGPYEYKKIIEMLQKNELMDFNYVWAEHLENWTPIYQLEEFSKDRFQNILQSNESELQSAFIKRTSSRIEKTVPLIGHNSIRFFDGEIVSISESGALCLLNSPLVQVGDQVKLHIKLGSSEETSFNVEAEIIRKNFSKKRLNAKSGLYYAIRFTEVQNVGIKQIRQWLSAA